MNFQILSHAGMLVTGPSKSLAFDPWILGSCYWRSWWNYPPVSEELVNSLNPDYIYLTHVHWDHFQGPSLVKLGLDKTYLVPKGNYSRIKKDLNDMGIHNVIELRHGETYELEPNFKITSYQFGLFMDSACVIDCDGTKILNLNDAKFMGATLQEMDKKHGPFEFTMRSHSSANSRLSYYIFDDPQTPVDDLEYYIKGFTDTVNAVRTRYAVPFASNQCHLHPDVLKYNTMARTPQMVQDYFDANNISTPTLKVMVSGDSWSSETGFDIAENDYFSNREQHLRDYQAANQAKIDKQYRIEAKAKLNMRVVETYYKNLFKATPFFIRNQFKNNPVVYVCQAGDTVDYVKVDPYRMRVEKIDAISDETYPAQVHVQTFIFMMCVRMDLFSHLSISKRVLFHCSKKAKKHIERLNLIYNCYEYDLFPLHKLFRPRSIETWCLRWREILLYVQLVWDKLIYKRFRFEKQLKPSNYIAPAKEKKNELTPQA